MISTRITCLYGSQPLSVVFAWKTATFGAELQVSMGPWYDLSFCAWKRAWLAPELLVSMGPSPHVRFFDAKSDLWTRITNLYGSQTWPVILCMYNSVISIRINILYGSPPSSVVYACKTATFGAELQVSVGPRSHVSFCELKTACLAVAAEGIFVLGGWPRRARTNFYSTLCRVLRKRSRGTLDNVQHALVTFLKARGRDTILV